jgi:hypothetical protein
MELEGKRTVQESALEHKISWALRAFTTLTIPVATIILYLSWDALVQVRKTAEMNAQETHSSLDTLKSEQNAVSRQLGVLSQKVDDQTETQKEAIVRLGNVVQDHEIRLRVLERPLPLPQQHPN